MNRGRLRYRIVLAGSIAGIAAAHAAQPKATAKSDPARMTVADISACMRANIVDRGSLRDFQVISTDREGKTNGFKVKLFWRPVDAGESRMVLQVLEPEAYKGTAYLMISKPQAEDVVHVYLPALDRVQPITGTEMSQPLWGTDFTLAEVKQVQGVLLDGQTQRLADATISDHKAFTLDTATDVEETGYKRVASFVDQKTCTLLKTELYADSSGPRKILEADLSTLLEAGQYWLMLGYKMRDLRAGTQTELKLSDIYLKEELPRALFTPEGFYKPVQ